MRHRQGKMLKVLLVLLAVAGLAVLPNQGWAAVTADEICARSDAELGGDTDNDGLTDYWECKGLTQSDPKASLNWPGFSTEPGDPLYDPDKEPLNPTKVNLFFIFKPLEPPEVSEFLDVQIEMAKLLTNPKTALGLGIVPLIFPPDLLGACPDCEDPYDQMDRVITLPGLNDAGVESKLTKAIRFSESGDTSDIFLWGKCKQGTPSYLDGCTIYTHSIREGLMEKCMEQNNNESCELLVSGGDTFPAAHPYTGLDFDVFVLKTIEKIIAHEAGHTLALSTTCDRKTDICHNKRGGEVMEAFAVFKNGTWKLGTYFDGGNIAAYKTYDDE